MSEFRSDDASAPKQDESLKAEPTDNKLRIEDLLDFEFVEVSTVPRRSRINCLACS